MRIGLLGGSFNPAHEGHRHITSIALEKLALDEVWWLVSPQNPLKPKTDMAPLDRRLAKARAMARHPRIRVSDIESRLGTRYTVDTLDAMKRRFPNARFVWIMGADNLIQLPRWRNWAGIFARVPVAIFDRPTYSFRALAGKAARRYARHRLRPALAGILADAKPPAWIFCHGRLHGASATAIRKGRPDLSPGLSPGLRHGGTERK